ncbi:MAG: ATP12 chaperone family protein [Alphaproteobacteria bacterium]|nr:ATP12 chaperone family protein [Alphaproteobacteria bacterium]
MKRFYTLASTKKSEGGFDILLDGKAVRTPFKNILRSPSENLAHEIVREWAVQEEMIVPDTMPLTQILSTKIDKIPQDRVHMTEVMLKYLNTDLLCYRAVDPPEMAAAQNAAWDPVLQWFEEHFGAKLETTTSLIALEQEPQIHKTVKALIDSLGQDRFTVLQVVTPLAGSIILALAMVEEHLNAQQVFECCHVEERFKAAIYNEEKYGPDPAQEKKDRAMTIDLEAAQRYLELL